MDADIYSKYYLPGKDSAYKNFRHFMDSTAEKYADNIAIRMRGKDRNYREWSFSRLKKEVVSVSGWLRENSLGPDSKIALLSENRPEWCITYLATLYSGLVMVPLDSLMDSESIARIVEFADIDILFYSDKMKDKAEEAGKSAAKTRLVCFDSPLFSDEINSFHPAAETKPAVEPGHGSLAVIIFTSGTTGLSKGVMLSHGGILSNVNASLKSFDVRPKDNVIVVLPLHHSYPTTQSFLSPLMAGASITIAEKLVGAKIIANIVETGGTQIVAVPLLFDKIKKAVEAGFDSLPFLKKAGIKAMMGISRLLTTFSGIPAGNFIFRKVREKAGIGTIKFMVSGGGPLSKETADFFEFLGCPLVQGYGLSENSPVVTSNTVRHHRNESVGFPVKGTSIRIAEPDSRGIGEIEVKSPSSMLGYYKNPEATNLVFTGDRWLRTGDLGKIKKGYLYLAGRLKNIIVTNSGKNIYPEEIEAEFSMSDNIAEVMVTGRESHSGSGIDSLAALCVPDYESIESRYGKNGKDPDFIRQLVSEEIAAVNKKLPSYKKISQIIIRKEEFEKTSSLKIKRFLYTTC